MPKSSISENPVAGVLDRNIRTIIDNRKRDDAKLSWKDRTAQKVTALAGNMTFVSLHLLVFSTWGFCNAGIAPSLKFDPGFSILGVIISMEALLLTVFVLINQNRMIRADARHADLNLQVSLLAEHEITHLVQLVGDIAHSMKLEKARNPELHELKKEIKPEDILKQMDLRQEKAGRTEESS